MPARITAPGGGLDARYEQLRHAALHARAEAFPLGLGVLTRGGVTAWQHALASLAPAGRARRRPPASRRHRARPGRRLPAPVAAELINVLAAVALAGASPPPP